MIICVPDSTMSARGMAADRVYQDADIAARRPRLDAQFVRSGWGTGCSVICRQVGLHSFRACKKLRLRYHTTCHLAQGAQSASAEASV